MSTQSDTLKWRNLKVGMLFLFGLALACWLGFYVGKNTGLLTQHRFVTLFVPDINGLTEGNLVSISGKKVGVVKSMDFTSRHDTSGILLTLDIRDEFFPLLSHDSKASIKSLGVLGDKYVQISLGHEHSRLMDGGEIALGSAEPGMEDLTASAIRTMKNVGDLVDNINSGQGTLGKLITTNDLHDKLTSVTNNLASLSGELAHGNGIAAQLLRNGDLAQDLGTMVKNLNGISAKLNEGDGSLGKMIVGAPFLARLNSITDRTDTLIATMSQATKTINAFGETSSGGNQFYSNVTESVSALHKTIGSLDSLFVDLKKNPKRYFNISVF